MSKRVLLLVGVILSVLALTLCAQPPQKPKEIEISTGVLVDLSGPLTTYGEDIRLCVEIAADKINKYFEEKGKPYRMKLYVEDTRVDPKMALEKVQYLYGKGIRLIIGPMGSGEVKNIKDFATANKIIVISPSSTAPPKYIGVTKPEEKKYIFRFVATDAFQTKAIAKLAKDLGIKAVVITYIGNAWGKGLNEYGRLEFEKMNITVIEDSIEYPDPPPADFSAYIATLESKVNELLKTYNLDEIAVVAFSYEEVATMLSQVKEDSILLNVTWIGCDGTAKSSKVIEDVPEKAERVGLYSTVAEMKGEAYEELNKTYYERVKQEPKAYGLNAYDAAWVIALSFAEVYDKLGKYDPDEMAKTIPIVSEKYSKGEYGVKPVSGDIVLDEYNDRIVPEYKIYKVENNTWVEVGTWYYETNTISWR